MTANKMPVLPDEETKGDLPSYQVNYDYQRGYLAGIEAARSAYPKLNVPCGQDSIAYHQRYESFMRDREWFFANLSALEQGVGK